MVSQEIGPGRLDASTLEGAYLLEMIDQYPSGLWARSLQLQEVVSKELERARRAANPEGRLESITYTYLAIQAIIGYTADPGHPAVKAGLNGLQTHRSVDGGYSSLEVTPTIRPAAGRLRVVSARHTAGAGLSMLLVPTSSNVDILRSASLLVEHVNVDGGWGNGGDPYGSKSECLSTALAIEFLSKARMRLGPGSPADSVRSNEAIMRGAQWLGEYFSEHAHWRIEEGRGPVEDTAWVISVAPSLSAFAPEIVERARKYLLNAQNSGDSGWSASGTGSSEIRSTLWSIRALGGSDLTACQDSARRGLAFIATHLLDPTSMMSLDTGHWSTLLYIGSSQGNRVSAAADLRIRALAIELQGKMNTHPLGYRVSTRALNNYPVAQGPIRRILIGSSHERSLWDRVGDPIESMLDRTPRALRWLIGAILLGLSVGLPIYLALFR